MKLNVSEWKEFIVGKVFDCNTTILSIKDVLENGNIPFISRTAENNGCDGYVVVEEEAITKGQCLTIGAEGIYCFYQPKDFATGNKVYTLRNNELNFYQYIFVATILNKEDYKYSYGRARIKSKLENEVIKLPIQYNSDGSPLLDNTYKYSEQGYVPDWQFMEDYVKSLHYKPLTTKRVNENKMELNVSQWEDFYLGDLFDEMYKGKAYTDEDLEGIVSERVVPYITRTDMDNGCKYMANVTSDFNIEKGNAISIGDTTATCFYQKNDFITSDHMVVLRASWLNQLRGLFFIGLFGLEKLKYSYGRAYKMDNIKKTIFKLPIQRNTNGIPVIDKEKKYHNKGYIPDWQFMENYINSLPYSDRII